MSEKLEVNIKYKDLDAELSGDYSTVRKGMNELFRKIRQELRSKGGEQVSVKGNTLKEIIISLRDNGFFDSPRDSKSVNERINELGKTDQTKNAISMQLKRISEEGELVRKSKKFFKESGRGYSYVAPWYDLEQHRGEK
ncbi:MAG: hypothetical protein ACLFTQ_03615 [Candidatus Aenigmatarchaeota archaeon]